jgi:hypothetical protein
MKQYIVLSMVSLYVLFSTHTIAQETNFKEFINQTDEEINSQSQLCDYFFARIPVISESEESEIKVLLRHDEFVIVLFNEIQLEGFGESQETLFIFDWSAKLLNEFEYGYIRGDDLYSHSLDCSFIDDLSFVCNERIDEGTLIEVMDDNGEFIRMDYQHLRSETVSYSYIINNEGEILEIIPDNNENP